MLEYFGLLGLDLGCAAAQRTAAAREASAAKRTQTFWSALTLDDLHDALRSTLDPSFRPTKGFKPSDCDFRSSDVGHSLADSTNP